MSASLRALLGGVIDYAGLFPPARLDFESAYRNYLRYRGEADAWMLGRFVCPAARLGEIDRFRDEILGAKQPFALTVIGRGGETTADWAEGLRADLGVAASFRARHGGRVSADVFEVKLPSALSGEGLRDLLPQAARIIDGSGEWPIFPYVEVSFGGDWRARLPTIAAALAEWNQGAPADRPARSFGVKIRTGGLESSAVPSVEQVAFAIAASRDAGVALKATAGLHHPFRHFDAGLGAKVHGFVNVFGAGVLAQARCLPENEIRNIIADENGEDFDFTEEAFRWREVAATPAEVLAGRRLMTSFGSCSFDEPRDDLRRLGLL